MPDRQRECIRGQRACRHHFYFGQLIFAGEAEADDRLGRSPGVDRAACRVNVVHDLNVFRSEPAGEVNHVNPRKHHDQREEEDVLFSHNRKTSRALPAQITQTTRPWKKFQKQTTTTLIDVQLYLLRDGQTKLRRFQTGTTTHFGSRRPAPTSVAWSEGCSDRSVRPA